MPQLNKKDTIALIGVVATLLFILLDLFVLENHSLERGWPLLIGLIFMAITILFLKDKPIIILIASIALCLTDAHFIVVNKPVFYIGAAIFIFLVVSCIFPNQIPTYKYTKYIWYLPAIFKIILFFILIFIAIAASLEMGYNTSFLSGIKAFYTISLPPLFLAITYLALSYWVMSLHDKFAITVSTPESAEQYSESGDVPTDGQSIAAKTATTTTVNKPNILDQFMNKSQAQQATSIAESLKQYKELLDNDIITQEEFDDMKKKLLN